MLCCAALNVFILLKRNGKAWIWISERHLTHRPNPISLFLYFPCSKQPMRKRVHACVVHFVRTPVLIRPARVPLFCSTTPILPLFPPCLLTPSPSSPPCPRATKPLDSWCFVRWQKKKVFEIVTRASWVGEKKIIIIIRGITAQSAAPNCCLMMVVMMMDLFRFIVEAFLGKRYTAAHAHHPIIMTVIGRQFLGHARNRPRGQRIHSSLLLSHLYMTD